MIELKEEEGIASKLLIFIIYIDIDKKIEEASSKIDSLIKFMIDKKLVFDGSLNGRLSMMNRLKFCLDYNAINQPIIETYSSGENSFNCDEEEMSRFDDEVEMKDVIEKLFDINTLREVVTTDILTSHRKIALKFQLAPDLA